MVVANTVAPTSTVSSITSSAWVPGTALSVTAAANGSILLGSMTINNNNRAGYRVTVASANSGKLRLANVQPRNGEIGDFLTYTFSSVANATPGTPSGQSPDPLLAAGRSLASNVVLEVTAPLKATQAAKYDFSIAYGAINDLFRGAMVDTLTITYSDAIL